MSQVSWIQRRFGLIGKLTLVFSAITAQITSAAQPTPAEINAPLLSALGDRSGLSQIRLAAAERRRQLEELMYSDPQAVLSAAVSSEIRDAIPPNVRHLIEKHVTLRGSMEVIIEDGFGYSRLSTH
jgi:hypothetical protein